VREVAAWPVAPRAGEPAAREPNGDDGIPRDLGYSDFTRCRGRLPEAEYRALAVAFLADIGRLRRGEPVAPGLTERATALKLEHPLLGECRAMPEVVAEPAPVADLVRVATDHCPDASTEAADWVLGPWAEILDPRRPLERRALEVALCWHAATEREGHTTVERWCGDREVPPPALRARVRAVATAPLGLWRVDAIEGDRLVVSDQLGLGPRWQWDGPVRFQPPGGVAGDLQVGGGILARPVPSPDGWWLACPLAIPKVPARDRVLAWLHAALLVSRVSHRGLRREIFLARRGIALSRSIHEWLWSLA
jgi:hypothetical protein